VKRASSIWAAAVCAIASQSIATVVVVSGAVVVVSGATVVVSGVVIITVDAVVVSWIVTFLDSVLLTNIMGPAMLMASATNSTGLKYLIFKS
jgi:ABC-type cobalamin transport system permease subunit